MWWTSSAISAWTARGDNDNGDDDDDNEIDSFNDSTKYISTSIHRFHLVSISPSTLRRVLSLFYSLLLYSPTGFSLIIQNTNKKYNKNI